MRDGNFRNNGGGCPYVLSTFPGKTGRDKLSLCLDEIVSDAVGSFSSYKFPSNAAERSVLSSYVGGRIKSTLTAVLESNIEFAGSKFTVECLIDSYALHALVIVNTPGDLRNVIHASRHGSEVFGGKG